MQTHVDIILSAVAHGLKDIKRAEENLSGVTGQTNRLSDSNAKLDKTQGELTRKQIIAGMESRRLADKYKEQEAAARSVGGRTTQLVEVQKLLNGQMSKASMTAHALKIGFTAIAAAGATVAATFTAVTVTGIRFNSTMEDAEIGIAGILGQFDKVGRYDSFEDQMEASRKALAALKEESATSPATFRQLVEAFQATIGAGQAANVTLEEHVKLVNILSQAGLAFGLDGSQLVQESRALLTGNVGPDAQLAQGLGITKADIDAAKEAGNLYTLIASRLDRVKEAADNATKTYSTLMSNLKQNWEDFSAVLSVDIFELFKDGIETTSKMLKEAASERRDAREDAIRQAELDRKVFKEIYGTDYNPGRRSDQPRQLAELKSDRTKRVQVGTRGRRPVYETQDNPDSQYNQALERVLAKEKEIAAEKEKSQKADVQINTHKNKQAEITKGIADLQRDHNAAVEGFNFQQLSTEEKINQLVHRRNALQKELIYNTSDTKEYLEGKKEELEIERQLLELNTQRAAELERAQETYETSLKGQQATWQGMVNQTKELNFAQQFKEIADYSQLAAGSVQNLSQGLASAIVYGRSFGDVMLQVMAQVITQIIAAIIQTMILNALMAVFGVATFGAGFAVAGAGAATANAKGGAFEGGVKKFAKGGIPDVINSPTYFPMRSGVGLMGEAGPEAIMPLTRDMNGSLGVKAVDGGGQTNQSVSIGLVGMASEFRRFMEGGEGKKILFDVAKKNRTSMGIFG